MQEFTIGQKLSHWFLLVFIILLAAALRFYDLGGESYWYDEVIMLRVAQDNILTIIEGGRPYIYNSGSFLD